MKFLIYYIVHLLSIDNLNLNQNSTDDMKYAKWIEVICVSRFQFDLRYCVLLKNESFFIWKIYNLVGSSFDIFLKVNSELLIFFFTFE